MSSPYVKLGDRTLDQWKVTELKEELKKRKLTTKGLKEDLVKRLDEAVRNEMENSMDNEDTESELPLDQTNTESNASESAKDSVDREIDIVEKVDSKPENEIDALGEDKIREADSVHGTKAAEMEGEKVSQFSAVETTTVVSETVEPVAAFSRSQFENQGNFEDGDSTTVINNDGFPQEHAKIEPSDPNTQSTQANESSMPVTPSSAPHFLDGETQNEATHATGQRENDDFKSPPQDSSVQPLKHQVSEVNTVSGFQVTSDSVSTEYISNIEKNELKIDVITDNVQLELDGKHEMVQLSPSSAVPDGGESHPMDVEEPLKKNHIDEPLAKKDVQVPVENKENTEAIGGGDPVNVDSHKSFDSGDMGPPEKLSLDRSSGDDSMEEDIMESKQMDEKSDTYIDDMGNSEIPILKEEDDVDVVGHDKPVEMKVEPFEIKVIDAENEAAAAPTSAKRKVQDKGGVGNNEVRKVRRWNSEGLKNPDQQGGSTMPKGFSEPNFKPISATNNTFNAESPKERLVPPPSRPPSNSLRIDRFLRPFTLKAVQELLGKAGTVTSFWMDHIKTHCYVSYTSVEEAIETRNAVYNLQWPPNGGRLLVAEFVDPQEVKSHVDAPLSSPSTPSTGVIPTLSASQHQAAVAPQPSPRQQDQRQPLPPPSIPPPPLSNPPPIRERLHPPREQPPPARDRLNLPPPPPLPEKVETPIVTLDDLFRKTKATPRIYYLPLSDEQVAAKLKTLGKNVNQ